MIKKLALPIAFLAMTSAPASAETLWQNVASGMTWGQLKDARPTARPIPRELKSHYIIHCTHMDDPVKVFSTPFDVCYDLRGGTVNAVVLHNADSNIDQLSGVKPELIGKYGKPDLDECERTIIGRSCTVVFRKPGMWIRVSDLYFELGRTFTLNIRYEAKNDKNVPL